MVKLAHMVASTWWRKMVKRVMIVRLVIALGKQVGPSANREFKLKKFVAENMWVRSKKKKNIDEEIRFVSHAR